MIYKMVRALVKYANQKQIDQILEAAIERRAELFPDWEMAYIVLPKNDPEKRTEMLRRMVKIEEECQYKDSCFSQKETAE